MLIDIIIPVYNGEKYIKNCFDMFRSQATEDIRLVLVNDGSRDGSLTAIEKEIAEGGINAIVINKPNGGVSSARNAGIDASDAEYITFVDVDDLISQDYVFALKKAVAEHEFDVFVFPLKRVYATDAVAERNGAVEFEYVSKNDELNAFLANPTNLGVCNILLRREFSFSNSLRFAEGFKYYEDYHFLFKAFALADKLIRSDAVLYYYLLQDNSAMAKFNSDRITCLALIEGLEPLINANAPDFGENFRKWAISRLTWSLLWQGAMAAPSYGMFKRLYQKVNGKTAMTNLSDYPDKKVSTVALACKIMPFSFFVGARTLGKRKSKVSRCAPEEFNSIINCRTE